ncbi:MAG TPA: ribosome recycling factor [Armatimonadota bacterium]|nr:ribosome recycling factor [Armatimonadota bacterium]
MIPEILKDTEYRMSKAVEAAQHDFSTIRTGRANPVILEGIQVDYYGTKTPINQLAGISAPEPRLLVVTPWDKGAINAIEKAIMNSDVGMTPMSDGNVIRLQVPYLTEERRKDLIKVLHKKVEEHKVAVRNVRRDANEHLKDLEKKHEIGEDESKRAQERVQKLTDKYIEQMDKLAQAKEAELMEV